MIFALTTSLESVLRRTRLNNPESNAQRTVRLNNLESGLQRTCTLNNLESSSQLDHKSQRSQCRTGLATYKAPHRPAYWFVGFALLQAVTAKFSRLRRKILKNIIPYAETPYVRRCGFGRIEARARPKHIPVDERPYQNTLTLVLTRNCRVIFRYRWRKEHSGSWISSNGLSWSASD